MHMLFFASKILRINLNIFFIHTTSKVTLNTTILLNVAYQQKYDAMTMEIELETNLTQNLQFQGLKC